jgi:uroporphyrinogen decarboxylase
MKLLLDVLRTKRRATRIPIWFMRQAGRYLPEYLAIRKNHASFMEFCADARDAAEVTLQPLRRFDLDAAIIFSDILVIPHALGVPVEFITGQGPRLTPIRSCDDLKRLKLDHLLAKLSPTCEALSLVKSHLSPQQTLIGFAGAPWTVACYMIEGGGSKTYDVPRQLAAQDPIFFQALLDLLVEATAQYLIAQVKAGADVLKIFDSWAGACPAWLTEQALMRPMRSLIQQVRAACPETPILYFPRGCGEKLWMLAQALQPDGMALDQFINLSWVADAYKTHLPANSLCLQGGLDPMIMVAGGARLQEEVVKILETFKNSPYLFNAGHGMVPYMPLEHITKTIEYVRTWEKGNENGSGPV